MAYHEEDQVARLILNWDRWKGDKPLKGTGSMWAELQIAERDLKREFRSNFGRFEALGVEAALTQEALGFMVSGHRVALLTYHMSSLTFEMQAIEIVRVHKSTYHRRLERAHFEFMDGFESRKRAQRDHAEALAAHYSGRPC